MIFVPDWMSGWPEVGKGGSRDRFGIKMFVDAIVRVKLVIKIGPRINHAKNSCSAFNPLLAASVVKEVLLLLPTQKFIFLELVISSA